MKSLIPLLTTLCAGLFISSCASQNTSDQDKPFMTQAKPPVITQDIEYSSGEQSMKGFLAIPEGEGPFPGVVVVHEWWGQTNFPKQKAIQLAQEGYMAMAIDMYGDGKTTDHPKDAQAFATKVMSDMAQAEQSFRAGLETLKKQDKINSEQIAAIGYCFGGAVVLEMARRGVDMKMVASFHGNLAPLTNNDVPKMATRMLIFNGAEDPMVSKEAIATTRTKLKAAKVRYKFINFKGAKHSFTNPQATEIGKKHNLPLAYNKRADEKSWAETLKAFKIVFR